MKYLLVETDKVLSNIDIIRQKAGKSTFIAVLKANAYGLGLREIYPVLHQAGVRYLAVTEPQDALLLRELGAETEEILVLRSTSCIGDLETLLDAAAVAAVGSYDAAVALNGLAESRGIVADVHIKIDTGMGRYGFLPSELERILSIFTYLKNIRVTGMFTHFPRAFLGDQARTKAQHEQFVAVADAVRRAGFDPGMLHDCNSAALFTGDFGTLDAVRVGSAITGRMTAKGAFGLKRTGTLVSQVTEIRWLPKGSTVGYGSVFKAKRPTRVGVIPVGTTDGFMVEKSRDSFRVRDVLRYCASDLLRLFRRNKTFVTIDGKKARVIGRVGTTHTTVDLTELDVPVGAEVRLDVSPMFVPAGIERRWE